MTLKKLTDAIAGMTKGPWFIKGSHIAYWLKKDTLSNTLAIAYEPENAQGITLLRNVADDLVAVCEAASVLRKFLDEEIGMDKPELTMLRVAIAQLEKKLGEEP